jgi:hypothetical protein
VIELSPVVFYLGIPSPTVPSSRLSFDAVVASFVGQGTMKSRLDSLRQTAMRRSSLPRRVRQAHVASATLVSLPWKGVVSGSVDEQCYCTQ